MKVAIVLLAHFGAICSARAQSTFGSIRGTVSDLTGAVIAGASISAQSLDDGVERKTTSTDSGEFILENLKAGHYKVTAHQDGFKDAVALSVALDARQELRLPFTLSVAATATAVEVEDRVGVINTENATIGDTVLNGDLTQLPMNSRAVSSSPLASLALSPSVVSDSQGNISVGGATAAQTGFSVDGISTANVRANGALHDAYPSSEGIAETKVTAFNNNAEFAQIGDVTFTTKSGTASWHGSAFEYFQNDVLDSTIYGFTTKAPKNFNTFGGSLGGPVVIPGLWNGRNKSTFFFADYEGNRKTTSAPMLLLVPTLAERQGNLTDLVNIPGSPGVLTDPFTGKPYPNNTIPGGPGNPCSNSMDCINPVAKTLLNNYYPLPNANLGIVNPAFNYQTLTPIPSGSNGWDVRVDQSITPKQQVYMRYSWKDVNISQSDNDTVISPANAFLPNDEAHEQNRSLTLSYNYVITPTTVNEFRFGLTHFTENESFPITGASAINQLGLDLNNGINLSAHPTGEAFPTFSFSDGTITNIGQGRVGTTISSNIQFTDNLTRILHKHTLRFGVDARRQFYSAPMFYAPSDDFGDFAFNGSITNYSFGDFLLGMPQSFFAITSPQINAYSWHWGFYGQDEWQVNRHLTLSFGLRWELLPAFIENSGDLASFDPRINSIVVPDKFFTTVANSPLLTTVYNGVLESFNGCSLPNRNPALACTNVVAASKAGLPQGLRHTPMHDFDPRISAAFRPFGDDNTVIRAGFGLFTATTLGPMSFNNAGVGLSDLLSFPNSVKNGVPAFQFPHTSVPGLISLGGGSFEEGNDPNFKDPTSAQWNLTVERQVTADTAVRVSYVGQGTWHLPITVDLNQIPASTTPYVPANGWADPRSPYQQFGMLMYAQSIGNANYQAGTVEVQNRTSHGLSFLGSYTLAKSISNAQGTDAPTAFAGEEPYAVEIANRFNLRYDRGNVVGTPRQRFLLRGSYQLPYGRNRLWSGGGRFLNGIFGNWNFSTVTLLQTGQWLTPTMNPADDQSNTDLNNERYLGGAVARPDCVGNPIPANRSPQAYYALGAFAVPPLNAGRFGSCGLGILQGPGEINVNTGLAKEVSFKEHYRLRFEATFTNVLNHTNFAPPALNISNASTFGVLDATLPQGLGGNRTGQLAVRLDF
ncbi:MAG TPA: carboxypeptidase regulatory-like domain-containing protein [Terriglobales bacterium]|nr:carboxypeptidase regulatory-like domain-containing protein [Terriglobales bacterium]